MNGRSAFSVRALRIVFQSLPFDRLRANGLKNELLTSFLRQAQDRQGERIGKAEAVLSRPHAAI
ncbi:MAG: hypothetical protein LBD67_03425 [Candidatus Accumulibacter sp.]|nr:hypothetical protein [Accumulibacter sp.]